jgi:integrase
MSTYLRREADSFIFRRRVPDHLQRRFGQREIYRSLKTTVRKVAKARAAQLFVATEKLFCMVDEIDEEVLPDEDIRAAVRHWLSSNIWTTTFKHKLDHLSPGVLRECQDKLPDMLLQDWDGERVVPADQNAILHAWAALENADYEGMGRGETLAKTIIVLREMLKDKVDRRLQVVFAPETLPTTPHPTTLTNSPTSMSPNFSKLSSYIEDWHKDISAGYNHRKRVKDADQYLQTVEMFIGLMGDLPVGKISFETAAEFRELVLQMPAAHGKGATVSPKKELARARADKTLPRVTMTTTKRHFSGMNSIWNWLIYRKHVPATPMPFMGHAFPGTKSKKSARDDWSLEDLQRLFTSREYLAAPDTSALHWLPLIGLHTGMRLEEICRLRPATDIAVKDGILCFDIVARDGWDPKSEAGARVIPVHSWLTQHRFMDFVELQRTEGADYLFSPELPFHGKSISQGFSRKFSKLKIALEIGSKTTFHSFRHTIRTELESTDLKESHINAIMGHEGGGGEGRTYTKRVSTAKLKEVIEAFQSPLDLSFLETASANAPPPFPKIAHKKRKLTPPVFDESGKQIRSKKTASSLPARHSQ